MTLNAFSAIASAAVIECGSANWLAQFGFISSTGVYVCDKCKTV